MSILEHELLETVKQLDTAHQEQVLAYARLLLDRPKPKLTWDEWLAQAQALSDEIRAHYGDGYYVGSRELLEEAREERLNQLMGPDPE
jgi:hypothetical protein